MAASDLGPLSFCNLSSSQPLGTQSIHPVKVMCAIWKVGQHFSLSGGGNNDVRLCDALPNPVRHENSSCMVTAAQSQVSYKHHPVAVTVRYH